MNREVAVFARKSLLFVLPLIVLIGYVEVKLSRVRNNYNAKRTYFEEQMDSLEVLVLGSSHSELGVDPNCFSRPAFNLSNAHQSLYYDTRLILKYLDRMPRLRCVMLEVDYFSLGYQLAEGREPWRDYFYYRFWGIRYPSLPYFDLKEVSYIALYGREAVLEYAKRSFNVDLVPNLQPSGWHLTDTLPRLSELSDSFGEERAALHNSMIKPEHYAENLRNLGELLGVLRRRRITAVLFSCPVLDSYWRHTNPTVQRQNRQAINELCSTYGCRYADYSLDGRFAVADFYDADHLNARGARKFSDILDRDFIAAIKQSILETGHNPKSSADSGHVPLRDTRPGRP